jgi:lipid-binding SYLF domain-containing protein
MAAPTPWLRRTAVVTLLGALAASPSRSLAGDDEEAVKDARATVADFKKADPSISKFFESAAGWVVFPTVGKGGLGIGGAGGSGVLFEKGSPVGKASLVQVTIGLQAGGQAYSELVFLESASALGDFKKSQFALAAQVSAVAAAAGASANAKYERGVAVFTLAKGGLMYEASVGGQKFKYEPFKKK